MAQQLDDHFVKEDYRCGSCDGRPDEVIDFTKADLKAEELPLRPGMLLPSRRRSIEFCTNCGSRQPEETHTAKCEVCGYECLPVRS